MVYAHPAGEQCEFYSSQRFKQPRVIEEQNNLTEAEDVSKDSSQVVAFVLMGSEGHHTMGFILHKQGGDNVILSWHNHGKNTAEMF